MAGRKKGGWKGPRLHGGWEDEISSWRDPALSPEGQTAFDDAVDQILATGQAHVTLPGAGVTMHVTWPAPARTCDCFERFLSVPGWGEPGSDPPGDVQAMQELLRSHWGGCPKERT